MHPIVRAQLQAGRQFNPRGGHRGHRGGRGRIVIRGGGYWGWPQYYWPWPYYQQPAVQERVVCDRIPGDQECPDGTIVQTNADGSKTCCPPQATQATQPSVPAYSYGPYYGYRPWWGRWW